MGEKTNIFISIIEYFKNLGVPLSILILIAIFILIILVGFFWVILRQARLWYWKVNTQVEILKNIEEKVNSVELKVCNKEILQKIEQILEKQQYKKEIKSNKEFLDIENYDNENDYIVKKTKVKQVFPSKKAENMGKSGRVYTIEELEKQIKE
ncbi:hypothetical protein [Anaerovorax odorimutans]|uniref:hypothetical protein n=1 Tax=Anaerovorax odorimutans TaxID=109327 RepID=UPI000400C7B7|nr:hypothetical protein [Anaerovorax odorimutans]